MARTQQQRREDTIARLLDASIATIIEFGYARASAALIAKRAQLSDGAIFRHFPTMRDLMAATLREAGRRQLDLFADRIAQIPAGAPSLDAVLPIIRDLTANPTNAVIHELWVAARTDETLRHTLRDAMTGYATEVLKTARSTPSAEEIAAVGGEESFAVLVSILLNTFDGAAMVGYVMPQPEIQQRQVPVLMSLLNAAGDRAGANI
ncbi:TetR/AcrR family transcriptional regulator [Mycolicibacterium moriokaense]|nr:TetR/AcrR family transcriptional regulator [Mycolicibacterium moriokaense]